jgi:hypothetical protein
MTGDGGIDGIGDTDQRPLNLLIRVTDGFEKGPMGCPLDTSFGNVAFHPLDVLSEKVQKKIRYRLWG